MIDVSGPKTLKVAICEDMPSQMEMLSAVIMATDIDCDIATFFSGETFLAEFEAKEYDIIFLDIFMGALTGVETAERIREIDVEVVIIFTTSSEDFTREGYRLNAYKYLVKPVQTGDVIDALELALIKRDRAQGASITVVVDGYPATIAVSDIVFVESSNRKTIIHTVEGDYLTATTTDAMEKFLPAPRFLRSHRSYLVNLDHVEDVDEDNASFMMDNGKAAYIRVKNYRKIKSAYDDYLFGNMRSSI